MERKQAFAMRGKDRRRDMADTIVQIRVQDVLQVLSLYLCPRFDHETYNCGATGVECHLRDFAQAAAQRLATARDKLKCKMMEAQPPTHLPAKDAFGSMMVGSFRIHGCVTR